VNYNGGLFHAAIFWYGNKFTGGNMLSAKLVHEMKSVNVSVNSELTKERVAAELKKAPRALKKEIDNLSGLKRVSVNRVYGVGSISAKIAVSIAQVLDIDPFYLTGETDERGGCTKEALARFLTAKDYPELAKKVARARRKALVAKEMPESFSPDFTEAADANSSCPGAQPEAEAHSRSHTGLTEEEAVMLLRSYYLQSQFNPRIKNTLVQIQLLLIK
jgi:hypothetical protein